MWNSVLVILDYSTGEVQVIRGNFDKMNGDQLQEYVKGTGCRLVDVDYIVTTIDKIKYI